MQRTALSCDLARATVSSETASLGSLAWAQDAQNRAPCCTADPSPARTRVRVLACACLRVRMKRFNHTCERETRGWGWGSGGGGADRGRTVGKAPAEDVDGPCLHSPLLQLRQQPTPFLLPSSHRSDAYFILSVSTRAPRRRAGRVAHPRAGGPPAHAFAWLYTWAQDHARLRIRLGTVTAQPLISE